jgi:tetratricopeptide (TPR) repeat protein
MARGHAVASVAAVLATVLAVGCHPQASFHAAWPDVQVELRDDADRDQAIDQLWVMPPGAGRDRARDRIGAAIAHRITDAIDDDQPFVAAALLDQLTSLWQADPSEIGHGLAGHAQLLHGLKAVFAKAGALEPTVQTLILLAEVEPAERAAHLAELDEVLGFADELAMAENGPNATRAQPIALLEPTALALPVAWLVDRYVALEIERQNAVAQLIDQQGASMPLVRAHHDFLSTGRRIANILARAGRTSDIHRQLGRLTASYGADRELVIRAEVVADQPTPEAYVKLASTLQLDEHASDATAALAVCQAGLDRYPGDPGLRAAAGGHARALGRIDEAITLYEQALHATGEIDGAVALQLGKLYAERIQRLASGGRPSAANDAWHDALRFTAKAASAHPSSVWQQTTAIAESALGRGFASQGLLDDAKHALTASIERAPSIDAYETLVTIDVQTDRYADAQKWAQEGIAMLGDRTTGDRYRRAKLERLAGDSLRRAGKDKPAAERYLTSLRTWALLGEDKDLPRTIVAERALDTSRSMWWLGDPGKAVDLAMEALEHDPESEELATTAVAFLIEAGRYRDALDAYHTSLGEPAISEYHKTYMSLWIIGEAIRLGETRDRLATEYLASRRGDVWYEKLAQLAAGKLTVAEVRPLAITGPRRAELAFYGAILGFDPAAATPDGRHKLLEQVVAAHLVLDAEYDLARIYLSRP